MLQGGSGELHAQAEEAGETEQEGGREIAEGIGERDKGGSHLLVAIEVVVRVDLSRKCR